MNFEPYRTIMQKKIVVVGMGYVGVPVAIAFAKAGFSVVGINRSKLKVDQINKGISPIGGQEPGLSSLLRRMLKAGRLRATQSFSECRDAYAIIVAVQTPFDKALGKPDYSPLESAINEIGLNLSRGSIVIIESTVAPGTVEKVVKPILESRSGLAAGKDFFLGTCPERVRPGRLLRNLFELDRVVGGYGEESTKRIINLYRKVVKGKLHGTDCLTAEVVKTVENAYRDVQIAFANEVALICEKLGTDVYKVRELVNSAPYRDMHMPGAGVGGHCLPKDTLLLSYSVAGKLEPKLLTTARKINDSMPLHLAKLVEDALSQMNIQVKGSKIAILGLAYVKNTDDTRNTPAAPTIEKLESLGAEIRVHDPYVDRFESRKISKDLREVLSGADCLVMVTNHDEYKKLSLKKIKKWMRTPLIVDGRNVFIKSKCLQEGFHYLGIGNI
ncbi:MAG: nucleotide sugar dehydrogenase [Thermoproteota archaeon]